jgi:hypothetical protein
VQARAVRSTTPTRARETATRPRPSGRASRPQAARSSSRHPLNRTRCCSLGRSVVGTCKGRLQARSFLGSPDERLLVERRADDCGDCRVPQHLRALESGRPTGDVGAGGDAERRTDAGPLPAGGRKVAGSNPAAPTSQSSHKHRFRSPLWEPTMWRLAAKPPAPNACARVAARSSGTPGWLRVVVGDENRLPKRSLPVDCVLYLVSKGTLKTV